MKNVGKGIAIAGNERMTADEINEFLAIGDSDSDNDDWENFTEAKADDFFHLNETKENKRTFEKKTYPMKKENKVIKSDVSPTNSRLGVLRKKDEKYFVVTPTRIRVDEPKITPEIWQERSLNRQVVPISRVCKPKTAATFTDADWVLVGVVAQNTLKKDKNDVTFSMWGLTDLEGRDKAVKLFMFRDVHDTHWKEGVGTVVAILQPKLLASSKDAYKDQVAFTVDSALQIMVLGRSPDFGVCSGKTKNGDSCRNIVNKASCSMCSYHVQQGYFAATNRPGFTNLRLERLNERKRKFPPGGSDSWGQDGSQKPIPTGRGTGVHVNSAVSMKKLQASNITGLANRWGLLDKHSDEQKLKLTELSTEPGPMAKRPKTAGSTISNGSADVSKSVTKNSEGVLSHGTVTECQSSIPVSSPLPVATNKGGTSLAKMIHKKSAGSMNLVKCIIDTSLNANDVTNSNKYDKLSHGNRDGVRAGQQRTKPVETFENLKRRFLPAVPDKKGPVAQDYIELGLKPVTLNAVSSEVYRAELAKLRYAALAQKAGGHAALQSANRQQRLATVGRKNTETSDSATVVIPNPKSLGRDDTEIRRLLGQGSSNRKLVDAVRNDALDRTMDRLEQVDQMEMALSAQHKQDCVLFVCIQCKTRTPMKPRMCVADGHRIETVNGFKRFFKCLKCDQRTTSFDKYPSESCAKCGAHAYEKAGKLKEKEVVEEKLLVHGSEKRFINN